MISGHVVALGALGLVLCGVIGLEVGGGAARPEVAVVPVVAGVRAGGERLARADDGEKVVLARPLFSPDRRPLVAAAHSVSGLPRLSGIVVSGARKVALFAGPGRTIVAEEGLRVGAYDVVAISDSGVTVAGPGGTTVLRPVFDPALPAAARAPAMVRPEKGAGR
jgi:general secretion pathway protein N